MNETTDTTQESSDVKELIVALDLTQTEKDLQEQEQKLSNVVYDVAQPKIMKEAKQAVGVLRTMRTTTEKKRKEAGAILLGMKKKNDDLANAIMERIRAIEDPIKGQIDRHEAQEAARKAAEVKAEQDRIDGHKARINAWRELPGTMIGWPSSRAERALHALQAERPEEVFTDFEEYEQEASDVYEATCSRVEKVFLDARANEEAAERQRHQEAELQAMRERTAQLERQAEEARQREAQRIEAEQESLRIAEVAAQRREEARIEAEQQAERDRIQAIRDEEQRAENAGLAAEREEANRRAAEAARKAALTIEKAAQALVERCKAEGVDWPEVSDLAELLGKCQAALSRVG